MGAENREVETAANRSRTIPDAHRITRDDVWPIIVRFYLVKYVVASIYCRIFLTGRFAKHSGGGLESH